MLVLSFYRTLAAVLGTGLTHVGLGPKEEASQEAAWNTSVLSCQSAVFPLGLDSDILRCGLLVLRPGVFLSGFLMQNGPSRGGEHLGHIRPVKAFGLALLGQAHGDVQRSINLEQTDLQVDNFPLLLLDQLMNGVVL